MTARTCSEHGVWDDELLEACPVCLTQAAKIKTKLKEIAGFLLEGRLG